MATRKERGSRVGGPGTMAQAALVERIKATPSVHGFERKEPGAATKAFEAFKADVGSPGLIFEMLTAEKCEWPRATLGRVAKQLGWPKGAFVEWFTTEHAGVYDAALKVIAADLAVTAMEAALDATPEDVGVKKLQAETALKLAARFDRARFGEDRRGETNNTLVIADAGLVGEAGALLARLAAPAREVKPE